MGPLISKYSHLAVPIRKYQLSSITYFDHETQNWYVSKNVIISSFIVDLCCKSTAFTATADKLTQIEFYYAIFKNVQGLCFFEILTRSHFDGRPC